MGESVKKGKIATNIFEIMLSEVLKSCKKMISADRKTDAKQKIKTGSSIL